MGNTASLPEDIIYHISSFLTNKEVTRASILSKEYRNQIRERPTFVFDYQNTHRPENVPLTLELYKPEVRSIQSNLVRYSEENIVLEAFKFRADFWLCTRFGISYAEDLELYNSCINLALQMSVRNLNISMWEGYVLRLPAVMEKVVQFSAKFCHIRQERPVRCPNLKRLYLIFSSCGSEATFDNIIKGCPLLETLEMDFFKSKLTVAKMHFRIANHYCLKRVKLKLGLTQSFEVTGAPNLEYLVCRFKVPRLAWFRESERFPNLTRLSLNNVIFRQRFFLHLEHMFPKLVFLSIKNNSNLTRIKIASRTLEKIHLSYINELQEAELDVPSIAVFKLKLSYKDKLPKFSFTGKSGTWISHLRIRCHNIINTGWFLELKNTMLAAMKGAAIFLSLDFYQRVYFEPPNRDDSMPFPEMLDIRELFVDSNHDRKYCSVSLLAALEGIFWICRPQVITFRSWRYQNYEHPRLIHDFLLGWIHPLRCECVRNVTGIKLFKHVKSKMWENPLDFDFVKEGRGLELSPEALDCNKYVELLNFHERAGLILSEFYLEWITCGMHTSRILLPSPSI